MNNTVIPLPILNGGLYTGEPFAKGAAWANFPATPDADYMTHVNLKSANPPPGALTQYPGGNRPGNNVQKMPGVVSDPYGGYCNKAPVNPQPNRRFSKYEYL